MYQLILKPGAINMAKDAYDWYEEQQIHLGELFLTSLHDCISRIQLQPKANSKVKKNYRQARVRKFPYVIVYEIIKNEIIIFSVFHTSRDPKNKY